MNKSVVEEMQAVFREVDLKESKQVHWAASIKKDENCESMESSSINNDPILASSSSSASFSSISSSCFSSSDLVDDASSSCTTSNSSPPSSSTTGPLYELGDLMAQLPIKRGLSKFYNGKSQTFTSLSNVKSVEDLAKKEMMMRSCSIRTRMKSCKSYGGNLNHQHKFSPKPTITKRSPRTSFSPSFATEDAMIIRS